MKNIVLLIALSLIIPVAARSAEDPYRRPEVAAEIRHVRDLLFDGKYDEVIPACRRAQQKYPDLLVWNFAAMLVPQARMLETHSWDLTNQYEREWNQLLKLSVDIKKQRPYSAFDYLCLGGGYGVVGLHIARARQYRKAFQVGVKAISNLNKTVQTDPNCDDAYIGFGIYHYYRGVLGSRYKWMPFFADDRRTGLAELDRSRKGIFARPLADLSQVYLYKDEGKWAEGLVIAQRLRKEYPNGLLLPQLIGTFQIMLGQYEPAMENVELVLKSDPKNGPVHLLRGACLYYMGRLDEAERECRLCLELGATREYSARAKYFLGELSWKRGKYEEARAHWRGAVQLDGEYSDPRKALQRPTPK